jgi:hypothetical protein
VNRRRIIDPECFPTEFDDSARKISTAQLPAVASPRAAPRQRSSLVRVDLYLISESSGLSWALSEYMRFIRRLMRALSLARH